MSDPFDIGNRTHSTTGRTSRVHAPRATCRTFLIAPLARIEPVSIDETDDDAFFDRRDELARRRAEQRLRKVGR